MPKNIFPFLLLIISALSLSSSLEPFKSYLLRQQKNSNNRFLKDDEPEEIIDPELLPKPDDKDIYYYSILHSNDLHGSFYEKKVVLPSGGIYTIGGLDYLAKYIKIMRDQWGSRFMFIDSGDVFQGALESTISKGQILLDFLNTMDVKYSVIGNHEFDYGVDFLKDYTKNSKFEWLVSNMFNNTSGSYISFPNQKKTALVDIGNDIKIGIIGITTQEIQTTTITNTDDLDFEDYVETLVEQSKILKNQGANAIIALAHIGLSCSKDLYEEKFRYTLRTEDTPQQECEPNDEATILLNKLPQGTIDLFLGGHKHDISHHWINGVPIISNDRNGKTAGIIYLPFDRKTKKFLKDKLIMEGPLPVCEKIFTSNKQCDVKIITEEQEALYGELVNYNFHGVQIDKEESVKKIGDQYRDLFNLYDQDILTHTNYHIESDKNHENAMGNFYTDFLRQISGAEIAVLNAGSFRVPFYRGNISNATIYSFDPFGNNIVKFKAYGYEIKKMMKQLQEGKKGFYPVSGLKVTVKKNPKRKLLGVKLFDGFVEKEIEDKELYSIVSIDFCFPLTPGKKGGDDFSKVSLWFKPREAKYITVGEDSVTRDALINYLRNIDEMETSKYMGKTNPRLRIIDE